jgi:hypothetical protein
LTPSRGDPCGHGTADRQKPNSDGKTKTG